MKLYSYIWNERGTSKEQGANKELNIALAWAEGKVKLGNIPFSTYPFPIDDRLILRFYRSTEGEIVLSIRGNNRVRVEDKRR